MSAPPKNASIRNRLLVIFVLLVLGSSLLIGVSLAAISFFNGRAQVIEQLRAVAVLKESEIKNWTHNLHVELALSLAGVQSIRQAETILNQPPEAGFDSSTSFTVMNARRSLRLHLQRMMTLGQWLDGIFLLDPDGYVRLSTSADEEGDYRGLQPYFKEGQEAAGVHVLKHSFSSRSERVNTIVVVRPFQSDKGRLLGVLCGQARLNRLDRIMRERSGLGRSGETYLVGSNHILLTDSIHELNQHGSAWLQSRMIEAALTSKSPGQALDNNYRGKPVISVYRWLPELQAALLAEQSQDEAFQPIIESILTLAALTLLTSLLAALASLVLSRHFTAPLVSLSRAAQGVAGGNFSRRVRFRRRDEIGLLAEAFNSMSDQLQRAFEDLKESEEHFRTIFNSVKDGLAVLELSGRRIVDVNQPALDLLGYSRDEVEDLRIDDLTSERKKFTRPMAREAIGRAAAGEPVVEELCFRNKNGREFWVEVSLSRASIGKEDRLLAAIRDIDERRRAENTRTALYEISRAAQTSETLDDLFRTIHRSLAGIIPADNFFIALLDREKNMIRFPYFVDQQDENLAILEADQSGSLTAEIIRTRTPLLLDQGELEARYASGDRKPWGSVSLCWLGAPLLIKGQALGAVAVQSYTDPKAYTAADMDLLQALAHQIAANIERKKAEEALRESELALRQVIDLVPHFIYAKNRAGRYILANKAVAEAFGARAVENLIGKTDQDLPLKSGERLRSRADDRQVLETNQPRHIPEETVTDASGRTRLFQTIKIPFTLAGSSEPAVLAVSIDITESKRIQEKYHKLENQLFQSQKMEAIGTLASGIAHDFNNILQALSGYMQIFRVRLHEDQRALSQLDEVDRSISRASDLVRRLMTSSRRVAPNLKLINLNEEVSHSLRILERALPKMIALETRLAPDLKAVKADPGQLEQILMNLAANARDAMPDGGRLTVETRNLGPGERFEKNGAPEDGRPRVLLRVSDTGRGMTPHTLERIFEPFFTTKGVGEGAGLGLSTVYGLVQGHGGHIECVSRPGDGASFSIYLPAVDQAPPAETSPAEEAEPPRGAETILLVDDEKAIVETAGEMLTMGGYNIMSAGSGEEALRIYNESPKKIDLVLLDLGMPGLGGLNCLKELISLDPGQKVIIASGYSSGEQARQALQAGARRFVDKPYRLSEMLTLVREVLDED